MATTATKATVKKGGFRFDSSGIMRVLGGIKNSQTGLGTERDKAATVTISPTQRLSVEECQILCRDNGLLDTIVVCYPEDAAKSWASISLAQKSDSFDAEALWKYLMIADKVGGINNDCRNLKDYFVKASTIARRYGDCYLILAVADGQSQDQPINWKAIQSFVGVGISRQVSIEGDLYKIGDVLWHPDRVLRFCGSKLYDQNGELLPESDSVLQNVFTAFSRWEMGNVAGASMLADYNFLLIGIKGLGQALREDVVKSSSFGFQALLSRLLSVDMNRSVARSVAHDLDNEKIEMVNRTWAGAKDILESLEKALSASTDIPRWRMFNEMTGGGLSNNINTAHLAKADWHDRVNTYKEKNWRSPLEYILRIAMSAADSPTQGVIVDASVNFPPGSYTSDLEKIQVEKAAADRSKILIDSGVISAEEARGCYANNEFTPNITLIQSAAPKQEQQEEIIEGTIDGEGIVEATKDADGVKAKDGEQKQQERRSRRGE